MIKVLNSPVQALEDFKNYFEGITFPVLVDVKKLTVEAEIKEAKEKNEIALREYFEKIRLDDSTKNLIFVFKTDEDFNFINALRNTNGSTSMLGKSITNFYIKMGKVKVEIEKGDATEEIEGITESVKKITLEGYDYNLALDFVNAVENTKKKLTKRAQDSKTMKILSNLFNPIVKETLTTVNLSLYDYLQQKETYNKALSSFKEAIVVIVPEFEYCG